MTPVLSAPIGHDNFRIPASPDKKTPDFPTFIQTIREHLEKNSFNALELYFKDNIDSFRSKLDVSNELDILLERHLVRSADAQNCIRAMRLASIMGNCNIYPNWTKIALAICSLFQRNHSELEVLVKDMVLSDMHPLEKNFYHTILNGHLQIYSDLNENTMGHLVQKILHKYKEIDSKFKNPTSIPISASKI